MYRTTYHEITALSLVLLLCLAGCSGVEVEPAPTAVPPPATIASTVVASAPSAVPDPVDTPAVDPIVRLAGTYPFRPAVGQETADYFLVLNPDGTAEIEEKPVGTDQISIDAAGYWSLDGDAAILELTSIHGEPAVQQETIRIQFEDGFPVISDIKVGEAFVHLGGAAFSLGSGERHPLVRELNRRLARVEFLGFTDPGSDVYGEDTRQAVVTFQESQGLTPTGVLDTETWLSLDNPRPSLPTPTPLASSVETITSVPNLDDLPSQTDDGQPILYLTFDDGPSPDYTPDLLDLLDQYDARVTFFNVGKSVKKHPELVRECATRRHYIADHTWDHSTLEGLSHEAFIKEVERTRKEILNAAGDLFTLDHNVRYVRPPYGATDANTRQYAAELGFAVVLWDVDTQDWRRPGAEAIAKHLLKHASPGTIILMHDGGGDRSQTIEGLRTALPQLQEQGYVFRNIFVP